MRAHRLASALTLAMLSHSVDSFADVTEPHVPQPWVVQNCNDSGPDSLRDIVLNLAQAGDIVDLGQLPVLCGTADSVITLSSGEIPLAQNDLILQGPAEGTVTISGGHTSRALHHTGSGTLSLYSLHITDGSYHVVGDAFGGCVASDAGNLHLYDTVVAGCTLTSDTGYANGGGISAAVGEVTLTGSTISGNDADAPARRAAGGGVFAGNSVTTKYSTIHGNAEHDAPYVYGFGGGIAAGTSATILGTTIDGNSGGYGGALSVRGGVATIADGTISGNTSRGPSSVSLFNVNSATIANSTIAFNQVNGSAHANAVYFAGVSIATSLLLESSIIAMNTSGTNATPANLYLYSGVLDPNGNDNLVVASSVPSPPPGVITVTTDPKLGSLHWNGGPTQTHQLLPGSPARGVGSNDALLALDQRGEGYPRMSGSAASVDIGAVQFDTIFVDAFDR